MKFRCRNKWIGIGFGAVVFLFFLVFFTKLHPIVISTTDDYFGFTNHRQAVPQWGGSEPTRVVGAVFMPLISQFMSFFFRIFGGNLFDYLTFGWGFCVAAAITGLVAVMYHLLVKAGVSSLPACAGLTLFLLMHFWIFKQRQQDGNMYMLQSVYACTYFIYVIPNLLNAILLMWFHTDQDVQELLKPGKYLKKGLFVFLAYFCINSNIWAGAVSAAFLGTQLITGIVSGIRRKVTFRVWFKKNYTLLILLGVWFVSQFFEMSGARAGNIHQSLFDGISVVWNTAMGMFRQVNMRYLLFTGAVVLGGLISLCFRKDKQSLAMIGKAFMAMVLFTAYFWLSCSVVYNSGYYVSRPDAFYGAFFFGAIIVLVCFFELLRRFPFVKLVLPVVLIIILVECNSMGRTYQDSIAVARNDSVETHNRINQDILSQLKQAEEAGLKETKIYIPDYENADNWPYSVYAQEQIAKGYYKWGAINREIRVTELVPTSEKNREFGID